MHSIRENVNKNNGEKANRSIVKEKLKFRMSG
jgi:hypothetical protein